MAVTLKSVRIITYIGNAQFAFYRLRLTDVLFARWNAQVSLNFLLNAVLVLVSKSNGPFLLPRCGLDLTVSVVGSGDRTALPSPVCEHTVLGLGRLSLVLLRDMGSARGGSRLLSSET